MRQATVKIPGLTGVFYRTVSRVNSCILRRHGKANRSDSIDQIELFKEGHMLVKMIGSNTEVMFPNTSELVKAVTDQNSGIRPPARLTLALVS